MPTSTSPTPAPRIRAKVSSSASVVGRKPVASPSAQNLSAPTASTISTTRAPPARAPSPFKPTQVRAAPSSTSETHAKAKPTLTVRSNVTAATSAPSPSLPELRQRALTDTPARSRRGSFSSRVSTSTSSVGARSVCSPPALAPTASNEENHSGSSSVVSGSGGGTIKVRSKVTRVAEHGVQPGSSVPTSPSFPPHSRPTRVPSGSNLTISPPLDPTKPSRSSGLSPSSTSGHGRLATTNERAPPKVNPFRPFVPFDDSKVTYSRPGSPGRVDPAQIPLPPTSPSMSAVSFSSRSSISIESRGSNSSGGTAHHRVNGHAFANGIRHARSRSSVDGLGIQYSPVLKPSQEPHQDSPSPVSRLESDENEDGSEDGVDREFEKDEDKKLRKEAISNRKIADLEITNKSLLVINTQLESAKNKQAKEIQELRHKLRESLLSLPPSVYHAAKSSLDVEEPPDDDDAEDGEEGEDLQTTNTKADEIYSHCRSMLDDMLAIGRKALETKPEDFIEPSVHVTKVLSEEEARTWRGEHSTTIDGDAADDTVTDAATDDDPSRPLSPSHVSVSDELTSEEEVEASLITDESALNGSPLPPITVTPSSSP
ncbi:uncharacterized protein PHACADRAFT_180701 [Phanerochaete carnosa HHB-10118-sp]|uniref:Uncharacterized protein n=1 Tax=Phanerochaete carnosa (strain HHB-10118-sp) TaxID=650164 RepID=K5VF03_PHACS|nr:uncharacterized protein PHACADRAFT_180701 [Phanerochaete carnosa HHB-10118-sp]EKM61606.1 hypothetical protein PHACADRAFT_180701 [Phanerochaete carnosa HHB-10118-sp]